MLIHNYEKINHIKKYIGNRHSSPILIVCYTNHALDQLLLLISKFIEKNQIVRIGGRSKEESLNECNLKFLREKRGRSRIFNEKRDKLKNTIKFIKQELEELNYPQERLLQFDQLSEYCPKLLFDSLFQRLARINKNEVFTNWLGFGDIIYNFDRKNLYSYGFDFTKNDAQLFLNPPVQTFTNKEENLNDLKTNSSKIDNLEEAELFNNQRELDDELEQRERIRKIVDQKDESETRIEKSRLIENVRAKQENKSSNGKKDRINDRKKAQHINLLKYNHMSEDEVAKLSNLWELNLIDRVRFYKYLRNKYYDQKTKKLVDLKEEYGKNETEFQISKDQDSYRLISSAKVIGMTTTGAAKSQALVKLLRPKIVIAEEAAEVFESHIITCLTESCEQLILIGDNEQLCPTSNLYKLGKHYNMNVSLFERLVNNDIPRVRLNVQHRMRPEISFFMKHFYDDLIDNECVKSFENIKGISENMFFIDHRAKEDGDEESQTKSNIYEAEYLTRLCDYLLKQNYAAEKITILVAYGGQLFLMKKTVTEFANKLNVTPHPDLEKVRITPIDNYQGEENDIILLSLVRSNNHNSIGFLSISNRVCVAMSRAKKGFYLIGNFKHLAQNSKLWSNIVFNAEKKQLIGENLNLFCQNHPHKKIEIKHFNDFQNCCINGGCNEICNERIIECGHTCEQKCHIIDHKYFQCMKPCERLFKNCSLNHKCNQICFKDCLECSFYVKKILPKCGHSINMKCSTNPNDYKCMVIVSTELDCGHLKDLICHRSQDYRHLKSYEKKDQVSLKTLEFKCEEAIEKSFKNCAHKITIKCYLKSVTTCQIYVSKELKCGHTLEMKCCEDPIKIKCIELVKTKLNCGHLKDIVCHRSKACQSFKFSKMKSLVTLNTEEFKCLEICEKNFENCGHTLSMQCYLKQKATCQIDVSKTLKCGHNHLMKCCEDQNNIKCLELVTSELKCGHFKDVICHRHSEYTDLCLKSNELQYKRKVEILLKEEDFVCKEIIEKKFNDCSHKLNIECFKRDLIIKCKVSIPKLMKCGHSVLTMCCEDPDTVACMELLNTKLNCGHFKDLACHVIREYQSFNSDTLLKYETKLSESKITSLPNIKCSEVVEKTLENCGHKIEIKCFETAYFQKCIKKVVKILKCGHNLQLNCHKDPAHMKCSELVRTQLPCGHFKKIKCYINEQYLVLGESGKFDSVIDSSELICEKVVEKYFQECNHIAKVKCFENKCCVIVEKRIDECGHTSSIPCFQDISKVICTHCCHRMLGYRNSVHGDNELRNSNRYFSDHKINQGYTNRKDAKAYYNQNHTNSVSNNHNCNKKNATKNKSANYSNRKTSAVYTKQKRLIPNNLLRKED